MSLPSSRTVGGDDAAVLELLDAFHHRRGREADLLADLGERKTAILLHERQNLTIDVIEVRVLFA
jgi:hypothetical protein